MKDYIPNNDDKWVIKNNRIYYKRYNLELILEEEDKIVYIYFNIKVAKKVTLIVDFLSKKKVCFFFRPLQDKNILDDSDECIIRSYFSSAVSEDFYLNFKKIDFNLIDNLVEWCMMKKCSDKIKPIYDGIKKSINKNYYDYYSKKTIFNYNEEIRNYYNNLYRDIQIKIILY